MFLALNYLSILGIYLAVTCQYSVVMSSISHSRINESFKLQLCNVLTMKMFVRYKTVLYLISRVVLEGCADDKMIHNRLLFVKDKE